MRVLWISSLAWKREGQYNNLVNEPGAISGSLFEQEIIEGFEYNGCLVDIINTFPYGEKAKFGGYEWSHRDNSLDYCIKHSKYKIINYLSEYRLLFSAAKRILKKEKYDAVIVYLVHVPFLKVIKSIKRKYKTIQSLLICPDLVDMMDLGASLLKKLLKKIEKLKLNNLYNSVDKYVLFSKYMTEKIPVKDNRYIVIEGVNTIKTAPIYKNKDDFFDIVYAGSLQYRFGIENLVIAFRSIKKAYYRLHIYGSGPLASFIKENALVDSRIIYHGFVEHDVLVDIEKESDLLVNVRPTSEGYTRYSFPGKTFEYMMSGTPFLTTRLAGIPDEYYQYMFVIDNNEPETIREAIERIELTPQSYLKKTAEEAALFLLKYKNGTFQAKKIIDFLS